MIRSLHAIRRTFQLSGFASASATSSFEAVPLRIFLDHDDSRFCQVVADGTMDLSVNAEPSICARVV